MARNPELSYIDSIAGSVRQDGSVPIVTTVAVSNGRSPEENQIAQLLLASMRTSVDRLLKNVPSTTVINRENDEISQRTQARALKIDGQKVNARLTYIDSIGERRFDFARIEYLGDDKQLGIMGVPSLSLGRIMQQDKVIDFAGLNEASHYFKVLKAWKSGEVVE